MNFPADESNGFVEILGSQGHLKIAVLECTVFNLSNASNKGSGACR